MQRAFRVVMCATFGFVLIQCSSDGEKTSASTTAGVTASTGGDAAPVAPPTSRASDTTTTTEPELPCRPTTAPEGPSVEIAAADFRFEPSCISMSADQGLNVTNGGTVTHNVTLQRVANPAEEYLDADLDPGANNATEALNNQGPGPGVYRLYCKFHEAQGMEAYLQAT
ncbi:MAG: hypothetical protein HYU28_08975 [Actinobacteria bacterium]|nr:hypothetical protein [Actinomycetota bacterium]